MRISSLSFYEIGPFNDAALHFPTAPSGSGGELILLEGPNGCGKTTIAQAIAWAATILAQAAHQNFARNHGVQGPAFSPEFQQRHRVSDSRAIITLEHGEASLSVDTKNLVGNLGSVDPSLMTWLASAGGNPLKNVLWATHYFQANKRTPNIASDGPRSLAMPIYHNTLPLEIAESETPLGQVLVNFDYERMRASHYSREKNRGEEERKRLQRTEQLYDAAINRLTNALSVVLDRKVEVKFEPGRPTPAFLFDQEEIPFNLLGEGLRSTLAWLSNLIIRLEQTPWARIEVTPFEQEFWLVLDEVDVYLHPQMQRKLLPTLRSLFPNAHIYATTHSPFTVAAVGEGHVFSISPDPKTHRISGLVEATPITPGKSLEWVIEEIFRTPSLFLNQNTCDDLDAHDRVVQALRKGDSVDWVSFLSLRHRLMSLGAEVQGVVTMREVPVRRTIDQAQKDQAEA